MGAGFNSQNILPVCAKTFSGTSLNGQFLWFGLVGITEYIECWEMFSSIMDVWKTNYNFVLYFLIYHVFYILAGKENSDSESDGMGVTPH
jgi:hypothetical protein